MSSSIQNPSMSSAAKSVAPKKVEKKDTKVVTAPVVATAASEAVAPVSKKVVKKADVEPSSATVPAVTAQPVADALAVVEEKSWQEELKHVQDQLSAIGRAVAAALSASKRLERRANRDVKDAKKGKRKQRAPLAEGEERKPSIFQIPVPVSDELSVFLGGGKNNLLLLRCLQHHFDMRLSSTL